MDDRTTRTSARERITAGRSEARCTHVCVRLARRHTARATRDEAYARSLLDGHADDASVDAPIELLELSRAVGRTVAATAEVALLAAFYRAAALAKQAMIVGEV